MVRGITLAALLLMPGALRAQSLPFDFHKTRDAKGQDNTRIDVSSLQEDLEFLYNQIHQQKAYTASIQVSSSSSGSGTIAWTSLTSFPTACSLPQVVTGVGAALTCTEPSNVTGNAATVTTNANLTGPVTSVGNATTIVGPINNSAIDLSTVTTQFNSVALATTTLGAGGATVYVHVAGDTMTGQLTSQSTITIQGNAFSVGGSTFVVAVGSVGIGVNPPKQKLDVYGAVQENGGIFTSTGPYSSSIANARGSGANDLQLGRLDPSHIASGAWATLSGGYDGICSGNYATCSGGHQNNCTADYCFTGGGDSCNANSQYAVCVGGQQVNSGVVAGDRSFCGGGSSNRCQGAFSVGVGGSTNYNSGSYSGLVGGERNTIGTSVLTDHAFIGGGYFIDAEAPYCSVVGGSQNVCSGDSSMIPGGSSNTATGAYSFAAGFRAKAAQRGAFVWADSQNTDLTNSTSDQFLVRAQGGVYLQTSSLTVVGITLSSTTMGTVACNAGTGTLSTTATDQHGTFTAGVGAANCTYTFAKPWPKTPDCICADDSSILAIKATAATTSVVCTASVSMSGDNITYLCFGAP